MVCASRSKHHHTDSARASMGSVPRVLGGMVTLTPVQAQVVITAEPGGGRKSRNRWPLGGISMVESVADLLSYCGRIVFNSFLWKFWVRLGSQKKCAYILIIQTPLFLNRTKNNCVLWGRCERLENVGQNNQLSMIPAWRGEEKEDAMKRWSSEIFKWTIDFLHWV